MRAYDYDFGALYKELTYDFHPVVDGPLDIKYIPACSHWVQQTKPTLVNSYILEFLRRFPSG